MPNYRVFRMKDSPRQQFRWAPHVSGAANAKPKDFEPSGEVEALHEYDAWRILREAGTPHRVEWYPGVEHGFVFPLRLHAYERAAAERHWERLFSLFERTLRAPAG